MRRILAALAIGAALLTGAGAASAAPAVPRAAMPSVEANATASLLREVRYDRHGRWHGPRHHPRHHHYGRGPHRSYGYGYRAPPPHWRSYPAQHRWHRPPPPHWGRW